MGTFDESAEGKQQEGAQSTKSLLIILCTTIVDCIRILRYLLMAYHNEDEHRCNVKY